METNLSNPAFTFLREFKECSDETEKLVLSQIRKKYHLTTNELKIVFEKGLAGDYGRIYQADPQTLLAWVKHYFNDKNSSKNYLQTSIEPLSTPTWENVDWFKETNKCFQAFKNRVSEEYFHPAVYDRMMVDSKIPINAYMKYFEGDITKAKQKVIKKVFTEYLEKGFNHVYFIKE